MAFISIHDKAALPLGKQIAGLARGFAQALIAMAERQSRAEEIARLRKLSAADLAARGLTPERIVGHVFADRFYF